MTTTETTTTTLAFHHLVDPHLGDQEASLDVHPHLPMTLTLLTTRLEDLHGFQTQDLLEVPELPTILTVTVDPLEGHLEDHPFLADPLLGSLQHLDTVPISTGTSTTSNP